MKIKYRPRVQLIYFVFMRMRTSHPLIIKSPLRTRIALTNSNKKLKITTRVGKLGINGNLIYRAATRVSKGHMLQEFALFY